MASDNFYVIGGTMQRDARSYVRRKADDTLYEALNQGKFCYVLTSRQMGKSSLMVRTATRLREDGVAVAVLDLTALGKNLTPEQWYYGLLNRIGDQLRLKDELKIFRQNQESLGPLQRWMLAIREVVLNSCKGRVVIFIDEIDAIRSLPFSTDEFFAGIREFYNRRTEDAELNRLTFCLLGVATPSDLIQDTRTTPFNIGQRVELTDFTETEALTLAAGFGCDNGNGAKLLQRVVWWTNGHPYLTQRLCQAVAENAGVKDASGVDRLCIELFLSPSARVQDDNLQFVSNRMLKSEADLASLLDMYSQVRKGKKVQDDKTSPLVSILRLSGVTRIVEGNLRLRNRIYKRVFDQEWVKSNIPDAELRRQRAAYRKGLIRAASIAAVILLVIGALAFAAFYQTKRVRNAFEEVKKEKRRADQLLYAAQMNLAQQALEKGNFLYLSQILNRQKTYTEMEDPRGFEWYYAWNLCPQLITTNANTLSLAFSPDGQELATGNIQGIVKVWDVAIKQELFSLTADNGKVFSVVFSPDGKYLATGGSDGIVKIWDLSSKQVVNSFKGHSGDIYSMAFSPDGTRLATGSLDKAVKIWDSRTGREIIALLAHASSVSFSPDGKLLATGGVEGDVILWEVNTWRKHSLKEHSIAAFSVTFSPDGKFLATGNDDRTATLWDIRSKREVLTLKGHSESILTVAFSPDGKQLATGSRDKTVKLWNTSDGKELSTLQGHASSVYSIAFSPDGKHLATGGYDEYVSLWNLPGRKEILTLELSSPVNSLAFSPDGKQLVTDTRDHKTQLWDLNVDKNLGVESWGASMDEMIRKLKHNTPPYTYSAAYSPDGKLAASSYDSRLSTQIWDMNRRQIILSIEGISSTVRSIAFSPDGLRLATASDDKTVKLWRVSNGQQLLSFNGHSSSVRLVDFSPDGKYLVTGSDDNIVKIWDAHTGQELKEIFSPAYSIAFSPDGKRIAIGTDDGSIGLWDVSLGQELFTLKGHSDIVYSVAFSPDGQLLASGSNDKTVKLWSAIRDK